MEYIPRDKIDWKLIRYIKEPLEVTDEEAYWKYEFWLNEPLASWDVFSYWEKERIASMEQHLTKDDVLFDIGTEQGWCNLAYAKMVNPENMVLIEPTKEFWPNIRALWEKNFDIPPLGFYDGFFSNRTTDDRYGSFRTWPAGSTGSLIDRNKYQYIHDNSEAVPEITLDDYVERTGTIPTAITMDTEGSELLILRGAENTLKRGIKVWVSIHDDLAERDYGVKPGEVIEYMKSLGYNSQYLATDHEAHHYFSRDEQ